MFGRATIRLGIGPHSSLVINFRRSIINAALWWPEVARRRCARTGQWSWVDILFSKSNNYNNTWPTRIGLYHIGLRRTIQYELNEMSNLKYIAEGRLD